MGALACDPRARESHANFVPTLPTFVLNEKRGTKQNLKMADSGHGCASFSSSFKVCNDYLYDFFRDDDISFGSNFKLPGHIIYICRNALKNEV